MAIEDFADVNAWSASQEKEDLFSVIQERLTVPFTGPLLSDLIAVEDGVEDGQDCLTSKDIQDMESILQAGMVGYAYLYPHGAEIPKVYVFSMTPENIANFIGQHGMNYSEMTLTDRMDMTILTTCGGFIDKCPDRELLPNVLQYLIPIQMGEVKPKKVATVTMDTYDLYYEMLETAQFSMKMEI